MYTLRIMNFEYTDADKYTCCAKYSFGVLSDSVFVQINCKFIYFCLVSYRGNKLNVTNFIPANIFITIGISWNMIKKNVSALRM